MRFIVHSSTPLSGTAYRVVRWGDCAEDQLSVQADVGEVAVSVPAFAPADETELDNWWEYDTSTRKVTYNGPTYNTDPIQLQDNMRVKIRDALRATDWMVLPDSPLTTTQVTEVTNKRAYWRAITSASYWWDSTWDFTLPTYSEF